MLATVVAALGDMYLISGQAHLRLQPAVTLVAAHTKLSLYTVQCMVGKNAFVPQISVGKGAKGLFRAAVTLNGRTMLDVRKSVNSGFRPMLA